jgi:hypothetical protein
LRIPRAITALIARKLNIPDLAVSMFRTAAGMSGLDSSTLPVELLPLNTVQLSRGVLNFTVLQTLVDWVLPFWAEQQYDPASPSFVPRSHLGLSMNITQRNWTAAGHPSCAIEPIVDPRGLLTPFPDGWSVDAWLLTDDTILFPSRASGVRQALRDGLPIVETECDLAGLVLASTVYTSGKHVVARYRVSDPTGRARSGRLGLSIRPFNPEGVASIHTIVIGQRGREVVINGSTTVRSDRVPSAAFLSDRNNGDVALSFGKRSLESIEGRIACSSGLATALLQYDCDIAPGDLWDCTITCPLESGTSSSVPSLEDVVSDWRRILGEGLQCVLPHGRIAELFRASRTALVASVDSTTVRPGPATYHYFWFRDAAYMLLALDRLGHGSLTGSVVRAFPDHQQRSGMFRSQQGEWDSTGQAIWTIWNHALLTHDASVFEPLFEPMLAGVRWIERMLKRDPDEPLFNGLMPRGLSAEHLGLADVYYWDSFWSLAGVEAFERICRILGREEERSLARRLAAGIRESLECSIAAAMTKQRTTVISPGPVRAVDAGIIGSLVAWYPLQLLSSDDARMHATVRLIREKMFLQGMFYQPFVHSGLNAYLSLHVAEGLLYAGDAEGFWEVLEDVARHASSTHTYPEAIHPGTGGGCMGDGHHAWAAAEVVLAVRNAFVFERWKRPSEGHDLILLSGIPRDLFEGSEPFGIAGVSVPEGTIEISVDPGPEGFVITIGFEEGGLVQAGSWSVSLPAGWDQISLDGVPVRVVPGTEKRSVVPVPSRSQRIDVHRSGLT